MTHTYNITGMTCNNCVAKVRSELLKTPEVLEADVKLDAPQATITMQKHIPISRLEEAVAKAGAKYAIAEADGGMHAMDMEEMVTENSYYPIYLIFSYILGSTLLIQWSHGHFDLMQWMRHFMAGFFLIFSFFKLLNLKGFAEGYSMYDIVAAKVPSYGYVYPFIELALAVAFITNFNPLATNVTALVVMLVSIIGVTKNLLRKSPFQCACLGTVIKLPLSKVTFFEDLLMIVMSAVMLILL